MPHVASDTSNSPHCHIESLSSGFLEGYDRNKQQCLFSVFFVFYISTIFSATSCGTQHSSSEEMGIFTS